MGRKKKADRKTIDWSAMDDEEFGERILAKVQSAPAALTEEDLKAIERRCTTSGVTRRAALLFLSKPGSWLVEEISRNREFAVAAADLGECIDSYVDLLKGLTKLMKAVRARTMVALAVREDMTQILDSVRVPKEDVAKAART